MVRRASDDSRSSRTAHDPCAKTLFDLLPLPAHAKHDLIRRMTGPERRYHGLAHLDLLWDRHRRFAPLSGLRRCDHVPIALAIAYHDSVYEYGTRDSEARSAALWLSVSADGSICDDADRLWIAETIVATADHLAAAAALDLERPDHFARQWMLDLDLTPLGEAPDVFDANMADLAAEMPNSTPAQCRESLLASLRRFCTRDRLYKCEPLRTAFEMPALANIARHLEGEKIGASAPP